MRHNGCGVERFGTGCTGTQTHANAGVEGDNPLRRALVAHEVEGAIFLVIFKVVRLARELRGVSNPKSASPGFEGEPNRDVHTCMGERVRG
jgi:hypothetical protein